jgi:hypothetical protein
MYDKAMVYPVMLLVGLAIVVLVHHLGKPTVEDVMAAAPARVIAYLDTLGVAPQGAVLCRPERGFFGTVGIQCEAMVESVLTRFACDAETCWAR